MISDITSLLLSEQETIEEPKIEPYLSFLRSLSTGLSELAYY